MLLNSLLKKLLIIWVTAITILAMGVSATPENEAVIEFTPIPQLIAPKQAEGLENYLFDHDVNTHYPASLSSQIFTALGTTQTLDAIRVYGNAAYSLTVRANQQGRWTFVADLENRDLSALQPDQWHEFKVTTCITTTDLLFDLKPVFQLQEENIGLREIEIRVKKTPGCPIESTELKKVAGLSQGTLSGENQTLENTGKALLFSSTEKTERVVPGQAKKISHEEAELDINAEAVIEEKDLTIATLNDADLPALDAGMVNVTKGPRKGYRFLPSGKFNKKINVKIPYDKSLLPADKTEEDINIYYFDKESGRWQALKRVTLDKQGKSIVSETDHFTDMINATVTVPESPQSVLFNPTQIKDIKASDPSTGINFIEPPQVNNSGDVRLQYPIEIPPGRVGMQPQVAIGYNSAGGNGWVGMGWDVGIPTVTIDTRWGVPRYNAGQESETYLLNGEQLTPVAHRNVLQPRTPEKQFYPRVEGGFNKIIRHGTNPKNYCWEVTDKNGTISHYGCDATTNTPAGDSVLTDDQGNIFKWLLRETKDLHGNTVQYRGEVVTDVGLPAGTVPGRDLYIKTINYTGFNGQAGPYQVKFVRSRDLGEGRRVDAIISGRGGFKQVTADLLRKIEITYQGQMVRSYELKYQLGAFFKNLLVSVSQYGENGSLFHTHTFDYYDESRYPDGRYKGFSTAVNWNVERDEVANGNAKSLISVTRNIEHGQESSFSVSPEDFSSTATTTWGHRWGNSKGLSLLLDVNGDKLLDKVFRKEGLLYYRPNLTIGDQLKFGAPKLFLQPPKKQPKLFFKEGNTSWSNGTQFSKPGSVRGINSSGSTNKQRIYPIDINGDGIIDFPYKNKGKMLFGHLNSQGELQFSPDSNDTPYPLGLSATKVTEENWEKYNFWLDKSEADEEETQDLQNSSPLLDVVRRWQAPYDGLIHIEGDTFLVEDISVERQEYTTADGVRVAIQHNNNELLANEIAATNYTAKFPMNVDSLAVKKGDEILFRVQSNNDGAYDQVQWNPVIQYSDIPSTLDANQLDVSRFEAAKDFTMVGGPRNVSTHARFTGKVKLKAELQKTGVTTDNVTLEVLKNGNIVYNQTLAWDRSGIITLDKEIDVVAKDRLTMHVKVDSPIDLSKLQWNPENPPMMSYIASTDPAIGQPVIDANGQSRYQYTVVSSYDIYPLSNSTAPLKPWIVLQSGKYTVVPLLAMSPNETTRDSTLTMTVKRATGELVGKQVITVTQNTVNNKSFTIQATQDEKLYFEFSTLNPDLLTKLSQISAGVVAPDGSEKSVPVALNSAEPSRMIAQTYRGWTLFGYNGDGDRAKTTINLTEADLSGDSLIKMATNLQVDSSQASQSVETAQDEEEVANQQSNLLPLVIPFLPEVVKQRWRGTDDGAWIQANIMSSSRDGPDSVDAQQLPGEDDDDEDEEIPVGETVVSHADGKARAIPRVSVCRGWGESGTEGTTSWGSTHTNCYGRKQMFDANGDGFQDVWLNKKKKSTLRYTTPQGLLGDFVYEFADSDKFLKRGLSRTFAESHTTGHQSPMIGANGLGQVDSNGSAGAYSDSTNSLSSVARSKSHGDSTVKFDWQDVNADGLPDRISVNEKGELTVELNLGYKFAPPESWGIADINKGQNSQKDGAITASNMTAEIDRVIIDTYGIGWGSSESKATHSLVDINGDGLIDVVWTGCYDHRDGQLHRELLSVKLNVGTRFADYVCWPSPAQTPEISVSKGGSKMSSFQVDVVIPVGESIITLSNSSSVTGSLSRQEVQINSDINGDGSPDYVESTDEGSVRVGLNQIGRTHLLKTVHNPLGGSFTVDYTRTGNTYAQPDNRWVMSKVTMNDGHPGDGADEQVTTYRYLDGFYDRLERDFYGFKTVIAKILDTEGKMYRRVTQTFLNNSYYNKGLLVLETLTDSEGKKWVETENTYFLRDVATNSELVNLHDLITVVSPELRRVDKRFYEGQEQPGKATYETYEYDAVGNVIRFFDAADAGGQDDIEAVVGYFKDEAKHLFKANSIVVTSNGAVLRKRDSLISGVGDVTQVSQYLADGGAVVANIAYDQYGNITTMTGPSNYKGDRYSLYYKYDDQVFTHNTEVRDSFKYVSKGSYNLKYGKPENTTDVNNQPLNYIYDVFGRVKTIIGPYQAGTANYTLNFEYHPEARPAYAITQHFDKYRNDELKINDPIETVLFIDGIKRAVQTKKDASIHVSESSGQAQDKMVASGHIVFDFLGRSIAQYYPVEENLGNKGVFNPKIDDIPPTMTEYDVLDRTVRVTLPDNTSTTTSYGFGTDRNGQLQFLTRVVDANGIPKESYRDIGENITSVKEFNNKGAEILWTSYEYDPLGQIVKVWDNVNNLTQATYDNLGRRTSLNNPDTGLVETVYDLASNVIKKITPNLRTNGQAIQYDYEFTRLKSITYPNYAGNNVMYTYGAPGAECNRANRIVTVTDESGKEEFCYGPLGETVKTIKTVASETQGGSKNSPEIYTTLFEFDTFNRLQKLTYPDGELLTNQYDSGGLLRQITGAKDNRDYEYVNRLEYDKFDQRAFVKFGNGVISKYDYNPLNRRLANLDSRTKGKENQFQDLAYDYDKVGNILGQANRAAIKSPSQMGGATQHQYVYDDLYRLVHANGTFDTQPDKQHRYTFDMQYDSIHNILNKNQYHDLVQPSQQTLVQAKTTYDWSYEYKGTQPHAPTHIGLRTFTYDANGNQTGWTHDENGTWRQIVWDEENRIQQIIDNNHIFDYKYNHAGERVIKTGPQGETVYVNQFFVIRGGSVASKHVFAGTTRMVTKLVMQENASVTNMNSLAVTNVAVTTEARPLSPRRILSVREKPVVPPGQVGNENSNAGGNAANAPGQTSALPPGQVDNANSNAGGNSANAPGQVGNTNSNAGGNAVPVTIPTNGGTVTTTPVSNNGNGNGNQSTPEKGGNAHDKATVEHQLYFYHSDHLGSTGYVTDEVGELFQHIEYFPFGETWVEESSNTQRTPYLFTAKELDEDTGLYYFGARYYDARTSVWVNPDPILGKYLPTDDKEMDAELTGMGGVFNTINLNLYHYVSLNPVKYIDPDGLKVYIQKRPAKIMNGLLEHWWLKTDKKEAGLGPVHGGNPGDNYDYPWLWTDVKITDHSGDRATKQLEVHNINEDCVNNKLKIGEKRGKFNLGFNDCHTFVDDIIKQCTIPEPTLDLSRNSMGRLVVIVAIEVLALTIIHAPVPLM